MRIYLVDPGLLLCRHGRRRPCAEVAVQVEGGCPCLHTPFSFSALKKKNGGRGMGQEQNPVQLNPPPPPNKFPPLGVGRRFPRYVYEGWGGGVVYIYGGFLSSVEAGTANELVIPPPPPPSLGHRFPIIFAKNPQQKFPNPFQCTNFQKVNASPCI